MNPELLEILFHESDGTLDRMTFFFNYFMFELLNYLNY